MGTHPSPESAAAERRMGHPHWCEGQDSEELRVRHRPPIQSRQMSSKSKTGLPRSVLSQMPKSEAPGAPIWWFVPPRCPNARHLGHPHCGWERSPGPGPPACHVIRCSAAADEGPGAPSLWLGKVTGTGATRRWRRRCNLLGRHRPFVEDEAWKGI